MKYRIAIREDLNKIIQLKNKVKVHNKEIQLDIWQNGYPFDDMIAEDIKKGHARIIEDENQNIIAFTSFENSNEAYPNENLPLNYMTFSRFMVDCDIHNQGIGTFFIQQLIAEAKAKNQSGLFITVDFFNDSAIHLYKKMGFYKVGTVRIPQAKFILDSYQLKFTK